METHQLQETLMAKYSTKAKALASTSPSTKRHPPARALAGVKGLSSRPIPGSFVFVAMLGIALLGVLLYRHTLSYGLVLDDRAYVMDNRYLDSITNFLYPLHFKAFASSAGLRGDDPDVTLNFITRPLAYLTYFCNRQAGGSNPEGYRIVNILIHVLNGWLVFGVALLATSTGGAARRNAAMVAAAAAGLLFTAHPLMTESVTYIAQRFTSLVTFFILCALVLHILTRTIQRTWLRRTARAGSILAVIAAMLTKECGVTAPILLVLTDLLWAGSTTLQSIRRTRFHLLLLPLVPALVIATSWAQNKFTFDFWTALNITNVGDTRFTIPQYAMTQVCAAVTYLRMLLIPTGQNFDTDYRMVASVWELRFMFSAFVLLALLGTGWLMRRRWGVRDGGLVFLGIIWYTIALLPSSSIVPLPDLFAEHRSYLPSVGIFLALSAVIARLYEAVRPAPVRFAVPAMAAVCCICLSTATLARNEILKDDESIYRDAAAKSPLRPRVWNGLGTALSKKGQLSEALACFKKSVALAPKSCVWRENLTTAYLLLGKLKEAREECEVSIRGGETSARILHNYGFALCSLGHTKAAVRSFHLALRIAPEFRDTHLCLGKIYADLGQPKLALSHLRSARRIAPLPPFAKEILLKLDGHLAEGVGPAVRSAITLTENASTSITQ